LAPLLGQRLKAFVVVENKPGANTRMGSEWMARSPQNGNALLMAGVSFATNALLYPLSYDPFRDFRPVAQLTREHLVLAVRANLPAQTLVELAALARSQPGGLNCGASPGVAGIGCTYFGHVLGAPLVSIPFVGVAPMVNQLLGGHIDLAFIPAEYAIQHATTGRIRLLAVASARRLEGTLRDLPTLAEWWPGFSLDGFLGVLVPAGTAPARIAQLNEAFNFALADPAVRESLRLAQQEPVGGTPEQFESALRALYQHYQRVIARIGMQAP
jgi:tripartite-type tricarboxylate transporter receptor subunit TctC